MREHATTQEDQDRCVAALTRKCEILWSLLDAIEGAHVAPRLAPHAMVREEAGGPMVVLPERAVQLNATGREILDLCDGARSADDVARELRDRHPEAETAYADAHAFLDEMEQLGAVQRDRP